MKAFITSIGEPTTDLCIWSLARLGFEVKLILNKKSLWSKLKTIFENTDEDFLRVDADVVVNKNVLELIEQDKVWWYQALTFDWYKQDMTHGGVQFVRKAAIPSVRLALPAAMDKLRPETYLCRIEALHNPRMFATFDEICGLNGFHQNDYRRVKKVKRSRDQYDNYDWELAERLDALA